MAKLPDLPFLTQDFAPKGGGIDFLGLRQVNLHILGEYLLPGINNQTSDVGTYCIGAWIPWKFYKICEATNKKSDYTTADYRRYREAVEVAMSHTMRDGSPSCSTFSVPNNRIGNQQKLNLPAILNFKDAQRTDATSIYAAPLYGPSLFYLGLLRGYALSEDGKEIRIPVVADDESAKSIVAFVDHSLRTSRYYDLIEEKAVPTLATEIIDDLGTHGLNPGFYRHAGNELKLAFIRKLLPEDDEAGKVRRLSAKLIIETILQRSGLRMEDLRVIWYSGIFPDGNKLLLSDKTAVQQERWSVFQGRQCQRFILELFLRCFEISLVSGCRSIEEIVEFWLNKWRSLDEEVPTTFTELLRTESDWLKDNESFESVSNSWNESVHSNHPAFEWIPFDGNDAGEIVRGCKMLARWWLRTLSWIGRSGPYGLMSYGERERIPMRWFSSWVNARRELPFTTFLRDLFADLVFAQHVRIALFRFDGVVQRLRFTLGDFGIVPTSSANKLGQKQPKIMDDRLQSFIRLLIDLSILDQKEDGTLSAGVNAKSL